MKLRVIVHKAEKGGYWAECPALPGCATQGETEDELIENMQEAVLLWVETANEAVSEVSNSRSDVTIREVQLPA